MLENYFKIAWRNLIKNKVSSFINIGGLAVGMGVAMLIGLWIWDELSFDKYHQNYDRIARVMQYQSSNGEINALKPMPMPAAAALRQAYPTDFKYLVLSSWTNPHLLSFEDKNLLVKGNFMEPVAPQMLTLKMINGTRGSLKDPSSILLSQSASKAIFGTINPLDKVLKLDSLNLKVTGVYEDLPYNTTFRELSFIAPWDVYANTGEVKGAKDDWNQNSFQLFAQIADDRTMAEVSSKIKNTKRNKVDQGVSGEKTEFFLHPMRRWHLYAEFKNGVNVGGTIQYVWLFGIIGAFVLLLACINFMNLSTARSEKRAKEVGIRKAIGSLRRQLIGQFFSESLLVAFSAFLLSLLFVQLTLPFFNDVADKRMSVLWNSPLFWALSVGFSFITGLIAGSYPAFYLSSFQPVKVLKGTFRAGRMASLPRRVLVVIQFAVSVVFIIGTIVVFRQIQFAKSRPIGYSPNGLVMIRPYSEDFHRHFAPMRNDLLQTGMITEMAESGSQIMQSGRTNGGFQWQGKDPNVTDEFATFAVSPDFGKTIGWQLIEGRDFSKTSPSDASGVILNEAAVKYMGLKNPVGQPVTWDDKTYTILGVTKDIVVGSPYEPVKQTIFWITGESGFLNIRLNPAVNAHEALGKIETVCKKYSPDAPFDYKFVDEGYATKFASEEHIGTLTSFFAFLAIFISCLGLFGLASFVAEQRTREIGIRKVLGASVFNVWRLLSKDFVLLVFISLLIATPLSYYFMHNWLQNYEYRTVLSWWIFAIAGLGALAVTLLTVSFQAIKAAIANPVKSLRTE